MKTIFYSVILSVLFLSCKKQADLPNSQNPVTFDAGYLSRARNYLRLNMADTLYQELDTTSGVLTNEYSTWYFRIRFLDKPMEQKFVLLTTDSVGHASDGKIIELFRDTSTATVFNGRIRVRAISGNAITESTISGGYVDAWHAQGKVATNSVEPMYAQAVDPVYEELAEVDVFPDGDSGGGDYYLLLSSLGGSSGSGGSGNSSGSSGGGSSSGVYTRAAATPSKPAVRPTANRPLIITVETSYLKPGISVQAYLNCFTGVPDAGASYSIGLYVDLPVNDDPSQIFNEATGAVGHTFLGLTKSGSGLSVTQYVGFASTESMAAIVGAVTPGKVIDNGGHKFNACLSISVSAGQFATAMNNIKDLSGSNYDLNNFNCVDFSLSVINSFQPTTPIIPVAVQMPAGGLSIDTPQGLYLTLQNIQNTGGAALTGGIWDAGNSHGACN
jgi:hypothetical protein